METKMGLNMKKMYRYLRDKIRLVKQVWFNLKENHDFIDLQYKLLRKLLFITFTYEEFMNKTRNKTLEIRRVLLIIYLTAMFSLLVRSMIHPENDFFSVIDKGAILLKLIILFCNFGSILTYIYLMYKENKFGNHFTWLLNENVILNKSRVNYKNINKNFKQKFNKYGWILFISGVLILIGSSTFCDFIGAFGVISYFH